MLLHWFFGFCIELIGMRRRISIENKIRALKEIESNSVNIFEQVKNVMEETEIMILLCKEVMQLDCDMTPEKELMQQIAHNEIEGAFEKKTNEEANLAQKIVSKIKFSEEQKREMEELYGKFMQLKKKVDAGCVLKLEVERLIKALQEDEDLDEDQILFEMGEKWSQQNELIEHSVTLVQELVQAVHGCGQEVLKKLNFDLSDVNVGGSSIGVKMMGKLDRKPFYAAVEQKYSGDEGEEKAAELCSLWQDNVKDLHWHPFKTIEEENPAVCTHNSAVQEMIDEEDEKLCCLKKEFGDEACNAVVTALKEMKEYNPSGSRYVVPDLWNFEEGRRATMAEGLNLLKELKLKGM